ncbi:hypothetical protein Q2K19_15575 [Micromonospora soli]|uniref:hypothetical protein n=1 Tax=Micromonospora sp. NBRC 110009 TaxID=3061627 RepID=UPI002673FAE4|nr:hypothetical protein [Micromonospora sp. NBRC 110009]WKU01789.1 hypothetical protein Q2K19_15575 [Micromonospora sp. NBRC 110009]
MSSLLREVFEDRSTGEPDEIIHQARPSAVRRRIARARRRRAAATGSAVAAVAVLVGVVMSGLGVPRHLPDRPADGAPTVSPSPTARTIEGFPEYLNGARVLSAASASLPDTTATLTFVPTTHDLVFFTRCDPPELDAQLILPDGGMAGGRCGSSHGGFTEKGLSFAGIRVGKPATIRLEAIGTLSLTRPPRLGPLPATGTFAVAVGERIPFDEYPLPPRPATLPPLAIPPGADTTVRSTPGDALAPRTIEVRSRKRLTFFAQMQTPGTLRVMANGREVTSCVKWNYDKTSTTPSQTEIDNGCYEELIPGDSDKPVKNGDAITVTIEPQHVTGDWAVHVSY